MFWIRPLPAPGGGVPSVSTWRKSPRLPPETYSVTIPICACGRRKEEGGRNEKGIRRMKRGEEEEERKRRAVNYIHRYSLHGYTTVKY